MAIDDMNFMVWKFPVCGKNKCELRAELCYSVDYVGLMSDYCV